MLHLRFFKGMTQSDIAAELGISQMHVSRLLAKTLAQLRAAHPGPGHLRLDRTLRPGRDGRLPARS